MKKINKEIVIGNALIEFDKEEITLDEFIEFNKVFCDINYENNYCIMDIIRKDLIEFCNKYTFISYFNYENNSIIVYPNKQMMYRYFRMNIPNDLIDNYKKVIKILNNNRVYKKLLIFKKVK